MKIFKFKKHKKVSLSFLSQVGFDSLNHEFIKLNDLEKIPPISLELKELTFVKLVDFACRKIIYAEFLETVYPLILWDEKDYDNIECLSKTVVNNRIDKLLNSEEFDFVSPLFNIEPTDNLKLYQDQYKSIEENAEYSFPIFPELFVIQPKRPILPPMTSK